MNLMRKFEPLAQRLRGRAFDSASKERHLDAGHFLHLSGFCVPARAGVAGTPDPFVTTAALSISSTIASESFPPVGKTICRWPARSMISVRKSWLNEPASRLNFKSDERASSRMLSAAPVRKLQFVGS